MYDTNAGRIAGYRIRREEGSLPDVARDRIVGGDIESSLGMRSNRDGAGERLTWARAITALI
jgi:hypothetical protein